MKVDHADSKQPQLDVDKKTLDALNESAKWARFLGIVGFILAILLLFLGLLTTSFMQKLVGVSESENVIRSSKIGVFAFYFILASLTFVLAVHIFKFGTNTLKGIEEHNQQLFDSGMNHMKLTFRIWGITTLLYLFLLVIAFFVGLVFNAST